MIERLDYYLPNCGSGWDTGMPMGMGMGMGMPIGGCYGYGGNVTNRDALTLRGPLAYDQYGDPSKKTKEKDSGFWKGLAATAIGVGAGVLAWRTPAIKNALVGAGKYVVNLVKNFLK